MILLWAVGLLLAFPAFPALNAESRSVHGQDKHPDFYDQVNYEKFQLEYEENEWTEEEELEREAAQAIEMLGHDLDGFDDEFFKPEMVRELARLIKSLQGLTTHQIENLEKQAVEKKDNKLTTVFFDSLAQSGTNPAISFLIDAISDLRLSTIQISNSLKKVLYTKTPSDLIVRKLLDLSKEDIARNPIVREALWLTIGALMGEMCGREINDDIAVDMKNGKRCPLELKKEYLAEMEFLVDQADSHSEKSLAVNVLANSGIDLTVFPIERILRDRRENDAIRISAIEALGKLTDIMPHKIQKILLPLYTRTSESSSVRIAAFHQLMRTHPSLDQIKRIVLTLENEHSTRVFSDVYAALKTLSSSSFPCKTVLSCDIERSLAFSHRQSGRLDARLMLATSFSTSADFNTPQLSRSKRGADKTSDKTAETQQKLDFYNKVSEKLLDAAKAIVNNAIGVAVMPLKPLIMKSLKNLEGQPFWDDIARIIGPGLWTEEKQEKTANFILATITTWTSTSLEIAEIAAVQQIMRELDLQVSNVDGVYLAKLEHDNRVAKTNKVNQDHQIITYQNREAQHTTALEKCENEKTDLEAKKKRVVGQLNLIAEKFNVVNAAYMTLGTALTDETLAYTSFDFKSVN